MLAARPWAQCSAAKQRIGKCPRLPSPVLCLSHTLALCLCLFTTTPTPAPRRNAAQRNPMLPYATPHLGPVDREPDVRPRRSLTSPSPVGNPLISHRIADTLDTITSSARQSTSPPSSSHSTASPLDFDIDIQAPCRCRLSDASHIPAPPPCIFSLLALIYRLPRLPSDVPSPRRLHLINQATASLPSTSRSSMISSSCHTHRLRQQTSSL